MTAFHILDILSTSFTWNAFLLATFPSLYGPTHPKPSQLGWGQVIVEARSSDAALHHAPPWSNSPGGVLGHYPVEIQMTVPLSANQIGWRSAAE